MSEETSSSGSSVDIKIVRREGKRPLENLYIDATAEGTGESVDHTIDSEETRPKCVIHIAANPGGRTCGGRGTNVEVQVIRAGSHKITVYSEARVRQETIKYSDGIEEYTSLWRADHCPIRFHIEIRDTEPPTLTLEEYKWQGPNLPRKKIHKTGLYKQEEPESSVSGPE
jgi:hypothetical protein